MFGFLKKLFGGDTETNKAAGVQIEQAPVVDAKVEAANQAPYKVETPAFTPEVVARLQAAHDAVVASGQPDDCKGLDAAIAAQAAQLPSEAPVAEVAKKAPAKKKPQAAKPKAEKPSQKPAAITAPKKSGRKQKV
jgi:cell division septation protein DedD